jgi:hypothetical protein
MKVYGGVDVYIHIVLSSALVGGEWTALRPGCFTPAEEPTVPVGYEAGWTPDVEKTKFLTLSALELRPLSRPACSQSLY